MGREGSGTSTSTPVLPSITASRTPGASTTTVGVPDRPSFQNDQSPTLVVGPMDQEPSPPEPSLLF